jgi:CheY-like chemotaxis protein
VTEPRPGSARILIVDDEPSVRRFAARVLVEEGYLVEEAADGAEALLLVRGGARIVHVVVTDVVMPRLNGVELLARARGVAPAASRHSRAGMGIAPPCGMLTKPFSAERLAEEVRRCPPGADPLAVSGSSGGGR